SWLSRRVCLAIYRSPPSGTLLPYTTLFRSLRAAAARVEPGDAALLLAHALGRPRAWLYAHGDEAPDPAAMQRFEALLARREAGRSEEHTSELQSRENLVCRLLLEKKKTSKR